MNEEEAKARLLSVFGELFGLFFGTADEERKRLDHYLQLGSMERGRILNCALVIEHCVDNYLREHGLANERELDVMKGKPVTQKLGRVKKHAPRFASMCSGLRLIINIRHEFAHRLDYKVPDKDIRKLAHINRVTESRIVPEKPDYAVLTIENYTRFACYVLLFQYGTVNAEFEKIVGPYPKLREFLSKFDLAVIFDPNTEFDPIE